MKVHYNISEFTTVPVDPSSFAMYHYIALGSHAESSWYRGHTETNSINVAEYVNDHIHVNHLAEVNEDQNDEWEDVDDDDDDIEDIENTDNNLENEHENSDTSDASVASNDVWS